MLKLKVMLTFFVLDHKISFFGKFSPKVQNCLFELKFGTKTNSKYVEFGWWYSSFLYLNWKGPLVIWSKNSKIKIQNCFSWKLVSRLIWIWKPRYWYSCFLIWTWNTLFEKVSPNYQSYYMFLFDLIVSSFCFGKLGKIPENALVCRIFCW